MGIATKVITTRPTIVRGSIYTCLDLETPDSEEGTRLIKEKLLDQMREQLLDLIDYRFVVQPGAGVVRHEADLYCVSADAAMILQSMSKVAVPIAE